VEKILAIGSPAACTKKKRAGQQGKDRRQQVMLQEDQWRNSKGEIVVLTRCGLKVFDSEEQAAAFKASEAAKAKAAKSKQALAEVTRQAERLRQNVVATVDEYAKSRGLRLVEPPDPPPRRTQWNRTGSREFMAPSPPPSREECRERAREFERRTGQR